MHAIAQPPGTRLVPQAFRVSYRLGQAPDDDVRFMARCAAVMPSDASVYGRYSGEVAQLLGARLFHRNLSLENPRPVSAKRMGNHTDCAIREVGDPPKVRRTAES